MRHPEGPRVERRLKARQEQRRLAEEKASIPKPRPSDENRADRRAEERRSTVMSSAEVNDWLKRNGITGADRRRTDRRR